LSLGIGVPIQFAGALISILAFPGAYFYVVYRSQLGGAEFRANRLISFYLFLVVLVTLFLALSPLFSAYFTSLAGAGAIILGTGIVTALLSVFGFSRFQAFVERRFLGIARPTADLLPAFAGRLSTSFTVENLVDILEKEVLPSLLVRQSTLVKVAAGRATRKTIYLQGLKSASLPSAKELQEYLQAGMESKTGSFAIVKDTALRLAVPVRVGKDPVALWLLGRKDPDDHYSYAEQSLLRSLADQMAIALANIAQAQSLRLLYQIDIERQEDERARLALELHDDILNEVNSLLLDAERKLQSEALKEKHHALDDRIRRLIQGLRPPMLNYGLYQAFSDMAAQLEPETKGVTLSLALPASEERYDRKVEEHVYRVVQQAVENALRHGKAEYISINGSLKPGEIQILVEDDGIGFKIESADLAQLLEAKHFGMAGMNERAALIGAKLRITSTPRRGTQVQLHWKSD
jgi:signal transduction histidine kinase